MIKLQFGDNNTNSNHFMAVRYNYYSTAIYRKGKNMRGVNKLVVEIKSDGEYFEKALLFLRPDKRDAPQREISDGAEKLLNKINTKKPTKKQSLIPALIGVITGSALSWGIVFLIGIIP